MVRHIVCFGDSNTYGFCTDPGDCAEGDRFYEGQRWTCLLQRALGTGYLICEEGLIGRTTAFSDPLREGMNGLDSLRSCVLRHKPVDLLVVMLGTNYVKERFGLQAGEIAGGMERLILKAKSLPAWRDRQAKILVIAPPHISAKRDPQFHRKSAELAKHYQAVADRNHCAFLDAEGIGIFNTIDYMHLTSLGHANLAKKLAELVPKYVKQADINVKSP